MIAELFPPRIAATIRKQSTDWICANVPHVVQMAEQSGADVNAVRAAIGLILPPEPTPPKSPIAVDVVVPFWAGDAEWLGECVEALDQQNHCEPILHVASDGADWPTLPDTRCKLIRYNFPGEWGPYRITNDLVRRRAMQTPWIAIQDADDLSLPDRLWRQVQTMIATGADMISSAAENFLHPGVTDQALKNRIRYEPVILPGKSHDPNPRGRCVNTTRTMRLSWFRAINGFFNMRCTGDFQFDNRARFSGAKIIDDPTILARRRLHTGSMTGGVFVRGTDQREKDVRLTIDARDRMQASPTLETARQLGSLEMRST